ncbi:MAG: chromate efflux transporter [Verrucomicrobiota bacterium]
MYPNQEPHSSAPIAARAPSFGEAFRFWLKLGFISFGGPTGQIAIMHAELVEKRRWISEARFLHALNYCMLLPGPEAQQLATYVGWLLHGTWGGVVAGGLFVLPSMFILWALSWGYVCFGTLPSIAAVLYGLKPAVLAIVAAAVVRIGKKALRNEWMWAIAALAFLALFIFHMPFPLIVVTAALLGVIGGLVSPDKFALIQRHGSKATVEPSVISDEEVPVAASDRSWSRVFRVSFIWLSIWWLPVLLLVFWLGRDHTLVREAVFFSKAALVTFGGAYAVLPYVSQQAVGTYGWLDAAQMLDGMGLAETTPGPLIMVLQFVGFLGGWNYPGGLSPLLSATLGAFISTWTTFAPCFLWIFLGAPYIEYLRGNRKLTAALSAVTAAVVGVILNLSVWFGIHVLFAPTHKLDWFAVMLTLVASMGLIRWKWGVISVVCGSALAGLLWRQFSVYLL